MTYYGAHSQGNDLYHDGSKGMHWGVRRYQNYDGTLTPAGKLRYGRNGGGRGRGGYEPSNGRGGRHSYGKGSDAPTGRSEAGRGNTRARTIKRVGIALGVVGGLALATAVAAKTGHLDGARRLAQTAVRQVGSMFANRVMSNSTSHLEKGWTSQAISKLHDRSPRLSGSNPNSFTWDRGDFKGTSRYAMTYGSSSPLHPSRFDAEKKAFEAIQRARRR